MINVGTEFWARLFLLDREQLVAAVSDANVRLNENDLKSDSVADKRTDTHAYRSGVLPL